MKIKKFKGDSPRKINNNVLKVKQFQNEPSAIKEYSLIEIELTEKDSLEAILY